MTRRSPSRPRVLARATAELARTVPSRSAPLACTRPQAAMDGDVVVIGKGALPARAQAERTNAQLPTPRIAFRICRMSLCSDYARGVLFLPSRIACDGLSDGRIHRSIYELRSPPWRGAGFHPY